ncbi:hypothetical protein BDZ89DRAFT_1166982, partial [Hymenopellis radicata]
MKVPTFRPRLRINTKKLEVNDDASSGSVTPTLARYTPPTPDEEELRTTPSPTATPTRLTFLAIWDPESEQYSLPPFVQFVDEQDPPCLEVTEDEGFYDSLHSSHPDCEPHLSSRFSTSTTSTSNFVTVSVPPTPTPMHFLDFPPPPTGRKSRGEHSRPGTAESCPLTPTRSFFRDQQPGSSTGSLTSFISRKPSSRSTRPSSKRSFSVPAGPESPLSFLRRRVSSLRG